MEVGMRDIEAAAAATRETLLRIHDGDAAAADKQLCLLMEYLRAASPRHGIPQHDIDHGIAILAMLIQR